MAKQPVTIGWREWVSLPDLGIAAVKAKLDTGARTSSLHAVDIEPFRKRKSKWVRFNVHPDQRDTSATVTCEAPLLHQRVVRSSSGNEMLRPVIETHVTLLGQRWPIEVTLASRDAMGFRMLLGRNGLPPGFVVDPHRSFYAGDLQR